MSSRSSSPEAGNEESFVLTRAALALGILFAIYASLRPFRGWRLPEDGVFAFLSAPWPATPLGWDVLLNVDGYFALGACAVLAAAPRLRGGGALVATVLGLTLLSFSMETLQSLLPTRTPSTLDLATNAFGALAGGLVGLALIPLLGPGAPLHRLRARLCMPGLRTDLGLILLGAWFVALLAPRTLLYANGDMRLLFGVQSGGSYPPELLVLVEAVCALTNLVALALIVRLIAAEQRHARWIFLLLVGSSVVVRSAAFGLFWTAHAAFNWVTPGALAGLALGVPAGLAVMPLAGAAVPPIAAVLLVLSTLIVNLSPPNPYLWLKPRPTRQSELAPVSMLSRTTAMAWPLAALGFLGWSSVRARDPGRARRPAATT